MLRWMILSATHIVTFAIGFALGVYLLPILIAPEGPAQEMLTASAQNAIYRAEFKRDLKGSDFLHWGEGDISIVSGKIVHEGKLAPGPDYKLYLVKEFVDDEETFLKIKDIARLVGDVKTFNGFIADLPPGVDVHNFTTVLIWCETFSEFITAAKYR